MALRRCDEDARYFDVCRGWMRVPFVGSYLR